MILSEYSLSELAMTLPFPKRDANKYSRGKLSIIGGSAQYPGAACLASMAGQSMGAGYVEVLCAPESVNIVRACKPSLVVHSWEDEAVLNAALAYDDSEKRANAGACLIGSGFAPDSATANLLFKTLRNANKPVVIDGGAIASLATFEGVALSHERYDKARLTIVTPHMGEAARMAYEIRISTPSQNAAEGTLANFACALSSAYKALVVLKGATTFISYPDKDEVYVMRQGTSALAKAGTGDVLAGMVAAIIAQHTDQLKNNPVKACVLAATLHAFAGRRAAEQLSDICVSAEDVVANIPAAIRYLLEFV